MNNNLVKLVLVLVIITGIGYVSNQFLSLKSQQLKNEAVASCLVASGSYEYSDTTKGIKTTAPQKEYYKVCLTDKGYTTIWN